MQSFTTPSKTSHVEVTNTGKRKLQVIDHSRMAIEKQSEHFFSFAW